ncbi:kelch domain-containing protein 8B isoform X2 [Monodelphis domestica]|uniref:Kelch domain-containing protein 8B n=1 Tax=Monodelphis domestica TaxID=13616 RepID=A0A5F8GBQ4_MONDO|nr:kelch domain-containing protein 8B isoform X2 [Monodelphis domestica]
MASSGARTFVWHVFPAMPTCRVYCTPAHQDGHLFVLGGCSRAGLPLGTAELLDVASHKWLSLPPLPTARAGAAAVALGKQVLVIGGMDAGQSPLASVEVYHTDEGRWERRAALTQPAMGISALERGGRQGKLPVTAFEVYDVEMQNWTRYPSVPSRRAFASCAMAEGSFFSLGGLQQPGPHNFYSRPHFVNTVEMFDSEQGVWTKLPRSLRMREKRADFVTGYLGGRVVAVGGLGNQPCPLGSVEGFSLARRKWEALPSMPTARCSCSSLQAGQQLFVIGGVAQGPSGAVEALCLRDGV